mmetsp:Transcript_8825/g.14480  ORF Transcript_8825/g.14480 Transcript_8825/m.14480 type:complete len:123 (+) Transcript_8825:76-444(+)
MIKTLCIVMLALVAVAICSEEMAYSGIQGNTIDLSATVDVNIHANNQVVVGDATTPVTTVKSTAFVLPVRMGTSSLKGQKCEYEGEIMHHLFQSGEAAEVCSCFRDLKYAGFSYRCSTLVSA